MQLLDSKEFNELFSKKKLLNEGKVASKHISPSKLWCEVFEAFRLLGQPQMGEDESFESRGYAEAGNSRHMAIQKFLIGHPEVEWVDPATYVKENGLPFVVKPSKQVEKFIEKYPSIPEEEAKSILGEYETNLVHTNGLISFKLDGLIKYKGEYYIVEIKTIGKKDFGEIPLDKHQDQGKAYSFLLNIPKIAWIYECRENFKVKTAFQLIREEEHEEVRNRLNRIVKYKDDLTKLERNTSKCNYCLYRSKCTEIFLAKKEETVYPF